MIYSRMTNLMEFIPENYCDKIQAFLREISVDMEERVYYLDGMHLFARVLSYETPIPEQCRIEAHNRYVDIQSTIVGAEGISIFDRSQLEEEEEYSSKDDVAFYHFNGEAVRGRTINLPGYFTMLYPEDAHRPQEFVDGFGKVKKFVIKMEIQEM